MENSSSWKPAYYLGLIQWNNNKPDKAKALFLKCGLEPDFYPFYLARAKLFKSSDAAAIEIDLLKAVSLAPDNWRTGLELSRFYERQKDFTKAKDIAATYFEKLPNNYYIGLNLARQLTLSGKQESCIELLTKLKVLPNEGATDGQKIWRESNLEIAVEAISAKKYQKAMKFIAQSRTWPENLGVGKPYDTDERLPDFLELLCSKASGNLKKVNDLENSILAISITKSYHPSGSIDLLSAWMLRNKGNETEAANLVGTMMKENPGKTSTRWVNAIFAGDKKLADSIENESRAIKETDTIETDAKDPDFSLMLKTSKIFIF